MSTVAEQNFAPDRRLPPDTGPRHDGTNKVFDCILIGVFLLAMVLPFVGTWAKWDPVQSLSEKRTPTPLPALPTRPKLREKIEQYPSAFSAFFKDRFGFRNTLIYYVQDARFKLGLMTHNDKVLVGKDGWLFLSERTGPGFNRERGFGSRFAQEELVAWQTLFEKRHAFLKARGIPYVVTFAPDKQTIYPEYMPDGLVTPGPSRLDQLVEHLKKVNSPVVLVDMRKAIIDAKPTRELYFKRDTHWNDWGAWAGYEEIMKAVRAQLPERDLGTQSLSEYKEISAGMRRGGCVGLLGMAEWDEEWFAITRPPGFSNKIETEDEKDTERGERWERPGTNQPKILFLRDSFGTLLLPKLYPHFGHMYATFADRMRADVVEREKPDIVVSELVERKLFLPVPTDSPEISGMKLPPR
jgi:hypothetical protein